MTLEAEIWRRARRARDERFDGRFFVGVLTTGIYCRPVCPAPSPREEHVRYFRSAAEAAGAGLRPCLRCRPETSPGTPAWLGTSATVSRALRLLDDGALDEDGVGQLASRLGMGDCHLRRLFLEHLGASPVAVAQTRRLHFAKRLIDETTLPFTDVALASGFGSLRRFNAVVRATYRRTPSDLRRLVRRPLSAGAGQFRFRLRFRPPYDWPSLLAFLRPRTVPGVEVVEGDRVYRRTIVADGRPGCLEARLDEAGGALDLTLAVADARSLMPIVARVRQVFDLGADPAEIAATLGRDESLRASVAARPGLRVPGAWDRFEMVVRAVVGQRISVKAATTLAGRLAEAFGEPFDAGGGLTRLFPSPERLADADLSHIGVTKTRQDAIRALARAVAGGHLTLDHPEDLRGLPGIGEWTIQYAAMRAFGEPDAFPSGDLWLLRAAGCRTARDLAARSEAWRPWRAYAAMHFWQGI